MPTDNLIWAPQPGPQKALVDCPLPEVFFGGARGGGKTDGVLGKWALKAEKYGEAFNALMFRRTTTSSEDAIERARQIYIPLGARFVGSPQPTFRMPGGGRVGFRYLETVADAQEYQGRNLTDAWIEEAGQYPDPAPIMRLYGVLRSSGGVPIQMILTGNPGGPGQHWISSRYKLIPFPPRPQIVRHKLADGSIHQIAVIPSRVTDNRIMTTADPGYQSRLHMVGSEHLVRAWLDGDWSAVEGAYFDCWDQAKHVIEPIRIPQHWLRFASMDWGSSSPFSIGWWAVASDETRAGGIILPRGCMIRYREWYGQGKKLTAEEVAQGIKEREAGEQIGYRVLDPSAFAEDGGPSIAQRMAISGVPCKPADNKRVSRRGAMGGWDMMRSRLKGDIDGNPMIVCFKQCYDSIRTIPVLQHDQGKPEDLDTSAEDHAADDWRYACMSRPWVAPSPEAKRKRDIYALQDDEVDSWTWKTA